MDDGVKVPLGEDGVDCRAIADVDIVVDEPPGLRLQALQVPGRVAGLTEELASHVVVQPHHSVAKPVVVHDGLGANQSAATGNKDVQSRSSWTMLPASSASKPRQPAEQPARLHRYPEWRRAGNPPLP